MQWLMPLVAGWWLCNVVATILSKTVMLDGASASIVRDEEVLPLAFRDLRWLDLTLMQHLVAAVGASAWVALVRGDRVFPTMNKTTYRHIVVASVGNALGNLATNASFAAVSSSMTQVVKSCEPLFTLILTLLFYREGAAFGCVTLASVLAMVAGVCVYLYSEASFNLWGLGAAVVADIAFPLRNIYLKKAETARKEPMQRLAVASVMSALMLGPLAGIKLAVSGAWPAVPPGEGLTSAAFHFLYNAASVGVLQHCSPVTHAVLNLCKRVFVIAASLMVFGTPFTYGQLLGLALFFGGLAVFKFRGNIKFWTGPKLSLQTVVLFAGTAAFLFGGGYHTFPQLYTRFLQWKSPVPACTTAWVYERPIDGSVVRNIAALHSRLPGSSVEVYCGNSQCMSAIRALGRPTIVAKFLVVSDVVKDTPLADWLARHPLHKILTGRAYEDHLFEAVRLALLWHRGGVFFDPFVKLDDFTLPSSSSAAWVRLSPRDSRNSSGGLLDVSHFPPHHEFIANLTSRFALHYAREMDAPDRPWPVRFDFGALVEEEYGTRCLHARRKNCPLGMELMGLGIRQLAASSDGSRSSFGTLSYERRVRAVGGANIGDEIQGYAGVQFLPFVDRFLERERLFSAAGADRVQVFMNAWWAGKGFNWPPPVNVDPILVSMHIANQARGKFLEHAAYLRLRAPIGARDTSTLTFLNQSNVPVFFTGCLTLQLRNPNAGQERRDVYINDLREQFEQLLPEKIRQRAIRTHHTVSTGRKNVDKIRFYRLAYERLQQYSRAKVVITQRIHCALPCVAMGTPVIFIDSARMPGGGGSAKAPTNRLSGLADLFHTLSTHRMSKVAIAGWLRDFNWDSPPPNPGLGQLMRLKATSWNVIRQREGLYDSARKFGLLPLTAPAPASDDRLLFHVLLLRTPASGPGIRSTVRGLHWSTWRTIESVLHHHPLAEVVVHSDSANQSQFQVLTEAGYTVRVQGLGARTRLGGNATRGATGGAASDRIKMEILLEAGGVYVDTSVVLLQPIAETPRNAFVSTGDGKHRQPLTFMKFDKGHPFLRAVLDECNHRGPHCGQAVGAVFKRWQGTSNSSRVLSIPRETSTLHFSEDNLGKCLHNTGYQVSEPSGNAKVFLAQVEGIQGQRGKLAHGSVCKHLFNSFCVLCNEIY